LLGPESYNRQSLPGRTAHLGEKPLSETALHCIFVPVTHGKAHQKEGPMSKTACRKPKANDQAKGDLYAEGFECGNRWVSTGPIDRRVALIDWLQAKSGEDYREFLEAEADGECVGWVALAAALGGPDANAGAGPACFWETAVGGSEMWRADRIARAPFLRGFCDGAVSSRMNV
jgi:hypothetical protein